MSEKANVAKKQAKAQKKLELEKQKKRKKINKILLPIAAILIAVGITLYILTKPEDNDPENYIAIIDVKDYGEITVELNTKAAPITVENFVALAKSGFYDGLTFHRIMSDFMIQGGMSTETTVNTIKGEFSANGYDNPISHVRGTISMARPNSYDGATSQFFIVHKDSTFLDGNYAAFGTVTSGIEVVDAICEAAEPTDNNGTILPENQPIINSITIIDIKESTAIYG